MTASQLVKKARACVGLPTVYRLGGGRSYGGPDPRDSNGGCDCSSLVCWLLGLKKYQGGTFAYLHALNGGWLNTDGMFVSAQERTGYLYRIDKPKVGCVVVYPGRGITRKSPKYGHVGVVTGIKGGEITQVVHCSSGNYRKYKDAIQETGPSVFKRSSTIFAWASMVSQ